VITAAVFYLATGSSESILAYRQLWHFEHLEIGSRLYLFVIFNYFFQSFKICFIILNLFNFVHFDFFAVNDCFFRKLA